MTSLVVLGVAVAGGIGSALRYLTDTVLPRSETHPFPWGTIVVNVLGSFVLGFLSGAVSSWLPESWVTILASGLLGGYTTFSAASLDTVRLIFERRWGGALFNGFGVLIGCVAAATLGLVLGEWWHGAPWLCV